MPSALKGPNDLLVDSRRVDRGWETAAGQCVVRPFQGRTSFWTLFRGLAPTAIHVLPLRGCRNARTPLREQLELLSILTGMLVAGAVQSWCPELNVKNPNAKMNSEIRAEGEFMKMKERNQECVFPANGRRFCLFQPERSKVQCDGFDDSLGNFSFSLPSHNARMAHAFTVSASFGTSWRIRAMMWSVVMPSASASKFKIKRWRKAAAAAA